MSDTNIDWLPAFKKFIKFLKIQSKDAPSGLDGAGTDLNLYGSQMRFLEEMAAGLAEGVRIFYCLKSRQLGVTTISLAIDVFFLAMFPGTRAALVVDESRNAESFRRIVDLYVKSFPAGFFAGKFDILKNNRVGITFSNNSQLDFLVAGLRDRESFGDGGGYSLCHMTEVGRYGCPNALLSFRNALSEHNPNRLYIYESRAEGPNHWKDMWEDAADNPYLIRRFFIGWWSRADQRIPKSNPRFTQYGTYPPNEEERTLIAQVRESYGFTVDMEQLAWYRERANAKDMTIESMHAQQPWTEAQAFVTSGFSYFPIRMLQQDWDAITDWDTGPQFLPFEYIMGDSFFDTQIRQMGEEDPEQRWQLRVWENPVRGAKYVIGMDPAYGRNDWKDNHSISVWRCFSDKLVQVAEYAWADDLTRHATWVLAHLAGNYEDCIINLEITGPGAVVMQELDSLRAELRKEAHTQMSQDRNFGNFLTAARWYLYQRPDSMGKGYVYNTKTGFESKRRVLQRMKDDYFSRAMLIRSKPLIEEMMSVKQDNNEIGAPGRGKDDRVMAAAFAVSAWREWVQPGMLAMNMTYEDTMRREAGEVDTGADTVGNMVRNYLKRVEAEADEPPPETWAQARGFS